MITVQVTHHGTNRNHMPPDEMHCGEKQKQRNPQQGELHRTVSLLSLKMSTS
jgi:hypothetical protein